MKGGPGLKLISLVQISIKSFEAAQAFIEEKQNIQKQRKQDNKVQSVRPW